HREKIAALLHELPRAQRRELGSIPDLAALVASALTPFDGPMLPRLAAAIADACSVDIPIESFRSDAVPPYLRLTCRLVDEAGKAVAQSRDIDDLWERFGARARAVWKETAPAPSFERKGLVAWDFGDLPAFVARRVSGMEVRTHPAIVDRGTS